MPPRDPYTTPFINRDQFDNPTGMVIELVVTSQGFQTSDVYLTGATRQGTFTERITPDGTGALTVQRFGMTDFPFFIAVTDRDQNWSPNTLFVSVQLAINGDIMQTLVSGYIDYTHPISWPQTNNNQSQPGSFAIKTLTGADPAAGAEATLNLSGGYIYELLGLTVTLVTDVTVATRQMGLTYTDGQGVTQELIASATQIASLTRVYRGHPSTGGIPTVNGTTIIVPMSIPVPISTTVNITTKTANLQAADNYGALSVRTRRWLTG